MSKKQNRILCLLKEIRRRKSLLIFLPVCALLVSGFFIRTDLQTYDIGSKTLFCEDNGLIFTLTVFDGKNESKAFVPCLGHAWASVENRSGHSVFLKTHEVKDGEVLTFSVWVISGHRGVYFNLEPEFIERFGRYEGRQSLSMNITEAQLRTVEDYIDRNDTWTFGVNCSSWSLLLWNELAEDAYKLPTRTLVYTPERVQKALSEFDCAETDRAFDRFGEVFFYENGVKRELCLCS